jgi:hypothetical protein
MAFRLPRLRDDPIVNDGKPTFLFKRWWQSVVSDIENAIASIEAILNGLTGVEGSLTGLQAQADILDNLSDVEGTGLLEKTGSAALDIRGIGTADPANVLTMLDSDNRYLKSTGTLAASAATTTHKLAVNIGGTTYYILLSNV